MAAAEDYARWLVANESKQGTPEFDTVAQAYKASRGDGAATDVAPTTPKSPAYLSGMKDRPIVKDSAAQMMGPTFGFLDEIAGGLYGGAKTLVNEKPFSQNYQETRDYVRGAADQGMADKPVYNAAAQIGLTAPIGFGSAALAGGGRLAQYLASVGVGGISGAVNGLGMSTETTPSGMSADVAKHAALGAAIPFVGVPAARGIGAVAQNIASHGGSSSAMKYALKKIVEAFSRDSPNIADPAARAAARMTTLGPEARMVDSGGGSVRSTLDTLATLPGETNNAVLLATRARQATRGDRMRTAADDALGTNGQRMATTLDGLIADRSRAAQPLYERLHAIQVDVDPTVAGIVNAAQGLGALKAARQLAAAKQLPFTLEEDLANQTGKFSMRDLDLVKQALDDIRYGPSGANAVTGRATQLGNAVSELNTSLKTHLDDATGGIYRSARQAWEGPTRVMDAARAGRAAMGQDEAAIQAATRGMSPTELEGFRIGAFEGLRSKLGVRSGQTSLMEMWREPATQEKLRAIFGSERAYRQFASSVAAERAMKGLEAVGTGSQTARRQYGAGDLDVSAGESAAGALADAKTGNFMGLIDKAARAWNRVSTPEPVRDEMGRILLSQGANGREQLMRMQELARQMQLQRAREAGLLGVGGGLGAPGLLGVAGGGASGTGGLLDPTIH